MKVVLRKFGSSTGVALPKSMLAELGLKAGQAMMLNSTADGHITLAPKRRHELADLIAQCDLNAAPPVDLASWNGSRTVGREI